MTLTTGIFLGLLLLGLCAGGMSGVLGIGGGIIVVPALIYFLGFGYKQAVGTSLGMMLPPVGLFAFLSYYHAGHVDLRAAGSLALTFAVGALASAWAVNHYQLPDPMLKRFFGFVLLYVAGNMIFKADASVATVLKAIALTAAGLLAYGGARLLGRRWERPLAVQAKYQALSDSRK